MRKSKRERIQVIEKIIRSGTGHIRTGGWSRPQSTRPLTETEIRRVLPRIIAILKKPD